MEWPEDFYEPIVSQYPDTVVEKFARTFSRQHAYDGPGYCLVSYSRQLTVVNCRSDLSIMQPIVALVVLAILLQLIRMLFCCRK